MEIYNCIKDFQPIKNAVVTVCTFDGVHLGHQAIFRTMKQEAEAIDGETVVITFYPHPRIVLGLDSENLKFINTQGKKINRLEESGIDHLIIVPFNKEFASISSKEFINDLVVEKIHPKVIVTGFDHHFGKDRGGSFDLLSEIGKKEGFKVIKVEAQYINDVPVSSTKIRKLLNSGAVLVANNFLGYEYSITGKVVKGKSIGRDIGFPTANIEVSDEYKLIAAVGVYACRVEYMSKLYKGMCNIGYRPTVDHGNLTIEVNIFDFNKQIYGEEITIIFVDRMRDERKFENLNELSKQLASDKENTLKIL